MALTKRGLNSKIHLAVDAHGMPVRIFVTAGTTADCKLGEKLINGIDALALLADRGYDVNAIIDLARSLGMEIVIPPKKNRKEQREFDKDLYKLRHIKIRHAPSVRCSIIYSISYRCFMTAQF